MLSGGFENCRCICLDNRDGHIGIPSIQPSKVFTRCYVGMKHSSTTSPCESNVTNMLPRGSGISFMNHSMQYWRCI
jgi:hypothetical protein